MYEAYLEFPEGWGGGGGGGKKNPLGGGGGGGASTSVFLYLRATVGKIKTDRLWTNLKNVWPTFFKFI